MRNKDTSFFSFIIPAYNAEKTIRRCVESIVSQKYSDKEIIIVNDGSCDKTEELVLQIARINPDVKAITINNQGVSFARNLGISKSKGDWLVFVDADDELGSNFISRALDLFEKTGADTICFNSIYMDEDGGISKMSQIYPQKLYRSETEIFDLIRSIYMNVDNLYSGDFFRACWGKVFSADIIKSNKVTFPYGVSIGEDAVFLLCYLSRAKKVFLSNNYMYKYYRTSESVIGRFNNDLLKSQENEYGAMIKALKAFDYDIRDFSVAFWHKAEKKYLENELKAPYSHRLRINSVTDYLTNYNVRMYLSVYDNKGIKSRVRSLMEKNKMFFPLAVLDYWIMYRKHTKGL